MPPSSFSEHYDDKRYNCLMAVDFMSPASSSAIESLEFSGNAFVNRHGPGTVQATRRVRRGGHPAPPNIGSSCTCLFAGVIACLVLNAVIGKRGDRVLNTGFEYQHGDAPSSTLKP
jgi:hypothetical protein